LDGVPVALPALQRAERLQAKAARAGFDWENIGPVWDKIEEELHELREISEGGDPDRLEDELGDILFAVVNLARFLHVHPEQALQRTNAKFRRRFHHIEARARELGRRLEDMTLEEMDGYWNEAKTLE
jgi:MazG family protein